MAVYRVHKTTDYTVMSNNHLRNKEMSLKAKGLLSLMLSLPDDWDYTENGLVVLSNDGRDSVRSTLKELEKFGYLVRYQTRDDGVFGQSVYDVYEYPTADKPILEKPITEKPITDKPISENRTQLNTNISNTKLLNTNNKNILKKPTIEEVEAYCRERNNSIDAHAFIDFYDSNGWKVGKNSMKDWKACIRNWERREKKSYKTNQTVQELGDWINGK